MPLAQLGMVHVSWRKWWLVSEVAFARATVSREHLLDWSSTRRNLHCLCGTLPGPKGRGFLTWKDGAGFRMDDHMAWGGSFISNWDFFFEKYINQNLEVIPDTRNHPFFEGIPIPDLRKKTYIKQSNTANTYFRIFTHVWSVSMTGVVSDLGPIGREHYATF